MRTERLMVLEVTKIYKLLNEYSDAIRVGNTERLTALWHTDVVQMGEAEIQKHVQDQAARFPTAFSISPDVVRILGDHAFAHGSFAALKTSEGDGVRTKIDGKFLSIMKKQVDGSWKILVDCFN